MHTHSHTITGISLILLIVATTVAFMTRQYLLGTIGIGSILVCCNANGDT